MLLLREQSPEPRAGHTYTRLTVFVTYTQQSEWTIGYPDTAKAFISYLFFFLEKGFHGSEAGLQLTM